MKRIDDFASEGTNRKTDGLIGRHGVKTSTQIHFSLFPYYFSLT